MLHLCLFLDYEIVSLSRQWHAALLVWSR